MKRAQWALAVAACLMASAATAARPQNSGDSAARALVSKAIQAGDIKAKGAPAFRLEARIRIDLGRGQSENGKLALVWTPDGRSRQDLKLAAYHNIEVSVGKRIWTKSTMQYPTYPVFLTERAVNLWNWLRRAKGQNLSAPQTSPLEGETCVTSSKAPHPTRYCFDSLSGDLSRVVDSRWNVTIRYLEYAPFGARSFPRLMEVGRRGEKPFVEIRVVRLAEEKKPDAHLFSPPKKAKEMPVEAGCDKVEAAKLEKMVQPEYPLEAQKYGISGIVKLYAVIGTDGIARGMWPVNASTPVLTNAAIMAVSRWRYRPRTCPSSGAKFPQVQLITIVFNSR